MDELKIYYMDAPPLREKSTDVAAVNRDFVEFCEKMYDFMEALRGAGLAAPQVGRLERFFVLHGSILPPSGDEVIINPKIISESEETTAEEEGCLSFLSVKEIVKRPAAVTVEYTDLNGKRNLLEAEGVLARAVLHETEHLDGVLFIDHLSRLKRKIVLDRVRKRYRKLTAEGKTGFLKTDS